MTRGELYAAVSGLALIVGGTGLVGAVLGAGPHWYAIGGASLAASLAFAVLARREP